ncbi:MAG: M3 family metallopeptidase [Bacteroidales bacterium]|nr:M3 family metallopeptidase [Bacteroidales bacterium]
MNNPLLKEWDKPTSLPPFDSVKADHFKQAIKESITATKEDIERIAANTDKSTFENTIVSLDKAGIRLDELSLLLFNLNSAETSSNIQRVAKETAPLLSKFSNDVTLNTELFARIKTVYDKRSSLQLNEEQQSLLRQTYRNFIRGGAGLEEEARERFREIDGQLSTLALRFEENVLKETNDFFLHITDEDDLEGLPEGIVEAAAEEAQNSGRKGWVFTLHFPSYIPFMQYAAKRKLREKMYRAYSSRAFKKDKNDNRDIIKKIINLRREKALMLGFDNYAEFVLQDRMLDSPDKVMSFLRELFGASRKYALNDNREVKKYAGENGLKEELEKWDWAYYSEKLKKSKFNIDDEVLRPYFDLQKAENAIFRLAGRLYGLEFKQRNDLPVYHPDVKTFEVKDSEGKHLSLLLIDYHPRKGKSGGAWMTAYRDQHRLADQDIRPIISLVTNFSKPSLSKPALITHNELTTFLHEFGHALHGMMSQCTYRNLSGTNVSGDFVELPSQIMENWAWEKEWLDTWARHYKTGKKIPAALIERIKESMVFNEGYACNRQLSFGFLDMAWHTIEKDFDGDIDRFEKEAMKDTELLSHVVGSNMSCSFGHLFSGGYAAGYYGYKWSEVLDADAFSLFRKKGIYDKKTAESFRVNILEKGGSAQPAELYRRFRGKEPSTEALLKRSGFKRDLQGS